MSVLIFCDAHDGKPAKSAYEAVTYGAQLAAQTGGEAVAVTFGNLNNEDLAALGKFGASKVLVAKNVTHMEGSVLAKLVENAAQSTGAKIIVFSHDNTGKSVAPLVSAKLNAGMAPSALELPETGDGFVVKCKAFS
ncbi:MAG: electron transfer flavoprotein subunit alpha/FixB family protein, partial [Flavobacteriales bacterium]|nr:electron transfer flavoprotein subunit alpha/FixB family protein [Flavobacteriales bacterium]